MSTFINKLLGRDDESESHSHSSHHKTETSTSSTDGQKHIHKQNSSGDQVIDGRTVQHEGVNIKSSISSDVTSTVSMANQRKLNDLVTKLGSTHSQIDEYAKKQTAKIDQEIQREIDQVVVRTRHQQDELVRKANEHTTQIDAEYRAQLQKLVEEIDANKAKRIAEVEKELNNQQTGILQAARGEIDQLNQRAASMKIGALQQAQSKAAADANEITAQAAHLGESSTVHHSTGTTTIKTEISAGATTKDASAATATTTTKDVSASASGAQRTSESKSMDASRHQSYDSRK